MKAHITTEHKLAYLKQKLECPETPTKVQNEILVLFMGFFINDNFKIMEFFKELDRLVNKVYKGG